MLKLWISPSTYCIIESAVFIPEPNAIQPKKGFGLRDAFVDGQHGKQPDGHTLIVDRSKSVVEFKAIFDQAFQENDKQRLDTCVAFWKLPGKMLSSTADLVQESVIVSVNTNDIIDDGDSYSCELRCTMQGLMAPSMSMVSNGFVVVFSRPTKPIVTAGLSSRVTTVLSHGEYLSASWRADYANSAGIADFIVCHRQATQPLNINVDSASCEQVGLRFAHTFINFIPVLGKEYIIDVVTVDGAQQQSAAGSSTPVLVSAGPLLSQLSHSDPITLFNATTDVSNSNKVNYGHNDVVCGQLCECDNIPATKTPVQDWDSLGFATLVELGHGVTLKLGLGLGCQSKVHRSLVTNIGTDYTITMKYQCLSATGMHSDAGTVLSIGLRSHVLPCTKARAIETARFAFVASSTKTDVGIYHEGDNSAFVFHEMVLAERSRASSDGELVATSMSAYISPQNMVCAHWMLEEDGRATSMEWAIGTQGRGSIDIKDWQQTGRKQHACAAVQKLPTNHNITVSVRACYNNLECNTFVSQTAMVDESVPVLKKPQQQVVSALTGYIIISKKLTTTWEVDDAESGVTNCEFCVHYNNKCVLSGQASQLGDTSWQGEAEIPNHLFVNNTILATVVFCQNGAGVWISEKSEPATVLAHHEDLQPWFTVDINTEVSEYKQRVANVSGLPLRNKLSSQARTKIPTDAVQHQYSIDVLRQGAWENVKVLPTAESEASVLDNIAVQHLETFKISLISKSLVTGQAYTSSTQYVLDQTPPKLVHTTATLKSSGQDILLLDVAPCFDEDDVEAVKALTYAYYIGTAQGSLLLKEGKSNNGVIECGHKGMFLQGFDYHVTVVVVGRNGLSTAVIITFNLTQVESDANVDKILFLQQVVV
eukprot:m.15502 g.15502  ORF g.15502 m.15502 type:complete len:878 (+) comp5420_c0_seq1:3118-5751(+)